jgi:SAM-dependent methyltransferase
VIHEHPLAYLLGLEGIALLRSFTGEHDRAFVDARLAEVRRLLADRTLADGAVEVARLDTREGYGVWSRTYDGPNPAFDYDGPMIDGIAGGMPPGVALDAACGTGRLAALLAGHGHRVLGVDSSPDMLAQAREKVPGGDFRAGDLHRLPVDDGAVDLVTCSLALTHVPDLGPVLAEFARVLRPGGHVVLCDLHPEQVAVGMIPSVRRADGTPGRVTSYVHRPGDYLRAALAAGLRVRACQEPGTREAPPATPVPPPATDPGPWDVWPWSLCDLLPEAARATFAGVPVMILWHFQRDERPST